MNDNTHMIYRPWRH